jgi:hypothetical protein
LPVPGGPTISTPRSRLPPAFTYNLPDSISLRMRPISLTAAFCPRTSAMFTPKLASSGLIMVLPMRV